MYKQYSLDEKLYLKFESEFKNNKKHGKGKEYNNHSQLQFVGEFMNDNKTEGVCEYNGSLWKGKFLNDQKHGKGVLFFNDEKVGFEFEYEWDDNISDLPGNSYSAQYIGLKQVDVDIKEFAAFS